MDTATTASFAAWGFIFGLVVGLVPVIVGGLKGRLGLGVGGFFACAVAGAILGLILAGPVCGLFVWLIVKRQSVQPLHVKCPYCAEQILYEAKCVSIVGEM